jgi:signal transduction histidine kinase
MNLSQFDIRNTVTEVMSILQQKADSKDISLEHDFSGLTEYEIYHDEQRITQILINL